MQNCEDDSPFRLGHEENRIGKSPQQRPSNFPTYPRELLWCLIDPVQEREDGVRELEAKSFALLLVPPFSLGDVR